jgi:hypothetical protein
MISYVVPHNEEKDYSEDQGVGGRMGSELILGRLAREGVD